MRAETERSRGAERWLGYAGGFAFLLLAAFAAVLWFQEGDAVYLNHILSQIIDCL